MEDMKHDAQHARRQIVRAYKELANQLLARVNESKLDMHPITDLARVLGILYPQIESLFEGAPRESKKLLIEIVDSTNGRRRDYSKLFRLDDSDEKINGSKG